MTAGRWSNGRWAAGGWKGCAGWPRASGLAGFVLFGEWPDALAGLGIVLIVASGAYALHGARAARPEPAA